MQNKNFKKTQLDCAPYTLFLYGISDTRDNESDCNIQNLRLVFPKSDYIRKPCWICSVWYKTQCVHRKYGVGPMLCIFVHAIENYTSTAK